VVSYYFFIFTVAIIFFLFLFYLSPLFKGSARTLVFFVIWVFFVSSLFPGLISLMSPLLAFLTTIFAALLGGHLFSLRLDFNEEKGKTQPLLLAAGNDEAVPSLTLGSEGVNSCCEDSNCKEVFLLPNEEIGYEELINSAFQAKEESNHSVAVELFTLALNRTEDISVKGMICTELVFLHKEMGKYVEASDLMEKFMDENYLLLSPAIIDHFKRLVVYLRTMDQLLEKADHPGLPFSRVPRLIKIRAEKVFKENIE
jgi:hypothetical protein